MSWSNYQQAVFDFIQNDTRHCVVNAVAGSGKSTTGVEALERTFKAGRGSNLKFLAFNKHIEVDINAKLADRLLPQWASTYNAFGNGILRANGFNGRFVKSNKTNLICDANGVPFKLKSVFTRVASLCKNLLLFTPNLELIEELCGIYDIDIPKGMKDKFRQFAEFIIVTTQRERQIYDFDDQKFIPICENFEVPSFDLLMVDEFQDTCPVEEALITRSNSRLGVFGDPHQAIYSFKGTSADAMVMFKNKFDAVELPLSICYRCPIEVVKAAQDIVPHIECAPNAIQGEVGTINQEKFFSLLKQERDTLVLCRVTADLVTNVSKLLSMGVPAYVLGKDFKEVLLRIVDSVTNGANLNIADYNRCLREYVSSKLDYFQETGNADKVTYWQDLETSLENFAEGCKTSNDVKQRISDIVKEGEVLGAVCHMTIHKSKGLEGKKDKAVCILRPDKLPHPRASNVEEEMRLKYVAITRSRGQLYYVEHKE